MSGLRSLDSRLALALGTALVAMVVYANSLGNGFAYDDVSVIENNARIHSLSRLPEAVSTPYWPGPLGREFGLWRPLTIGTFALDWAIWDGQPVGFHVVNVVLHAIATVLVLLVLLELLPPMGAAAGALVFAVHPVHVEAVANVVGRAELLMTTFVLLACLLHLRGEADRPGRVVAIALLYAAATLSKETGIVLPALLLTLDLARGEVARAGGWGPYARRHAALATTLLGIAMLILGARKLILGGVARTTPALGAAGVQSIERLWTVVSVWPHYVRLIFWPRDLSADYTPEVIPILYGPGPAFWIGLVVGGAAAAVAAVTWRGQPLASSRASVRALATGIIFFVIAILPVSNIFFLSGVLLAERTLYLPSVGAMLAVGWFVETVGWRANRVAGGALIIVSALLALRTLERNPTWATSETVFETLIRDHPESGRVQWLLGELYFRQGLPEEGMKAYARAIDAIGPHYPLLVAIARDLSRAGRLAEAEPYLWQAHRLRPDMKGASHRLANLLLEQGRWEEAEAVVRSVLEADPHDPVAYHILADALARQGELDDAIEARRGSIAAGEGANWQQWYWLAQLLLRADRNAEAAAALDSASIRTDDAAARDAIRRLRLQADGRAMEAQ